MMEIEVLHGSITLSNEGGGKTLVWKPATLRDSQGNPWRERDKLYSDRELVVKAFIAGNIRSGIGIEGVFKVGKQDGWIQMLNVPMGL